MAKVSIIMSNYNCEAYIGKAIQSVLNQTYEDFEFIIIDDHSTDGSREIIDSFHDVRIKRIYFEQNEHMCFAFNYALKIAVGDYYARIDSDDTWEPEKLEKQICYMEAHPACGACFTLVHVVDENDSFLTAEQTDRVTLLETSNKTQAEWLRYFYFNGSCLCHPSVVIRRKALEIAGIYNYSLVQIQDYELWIRIAKKFDLYVLQERLTNYRWFMSGKNASAPSLAVNRRSKYEFTYVLSKYFDDIPDALFIEAFGSDFIIPGTTNTNELQCEKALLLLRPVFCGHCPKIGGMEKLITLLQNDVTREILRNKYYVTQKNFYELSASCILDEMETEHMKMVESRQGMLNRVRAELSLKDKIWLIIPPIVWNSLSKVYRVFVKRR